MARTNTNSSAGGFVNSVTGLDTDNTDPSNPVVEISVDGVTIMGDGTPGNPLISTPAGGIAIGDAVTGGTQGSVLFIDPAGVLAQDNANLFWNNANNFLGLGTTSPGAPLHVASPATTDDFELARFTWEPALDDSDGFIKLGSGLTTDGGTIGYRFNNGSSIAGVYLGDPAGNPQLFVQGTGNVIIFTGDLQFGLKTINTTSGDAATINSPTGRFRKDNSGTTFVLTNSFITANSIILLTPASALGTAGCIMDVVAGAGTATVTFYTIVAGAPTATAPSGDLDINFLVIN